MIWLYRLIFLCLSPVWLGFWAWRILRGKEDKSRLSERLGLNAKRPQGQLIWLHGASVGETLSILPLVEKLIQTTSAHVLVTSGTTTSAALMAKHLPTIDAERTHHRYVPLDFWPFVWLFMQRWRPDVSVFVESEWWPELLWQAPNPVLINARISDRSFPRYQKFWPLAAPFATRFKHILAQSDVDAKRLTELGLTQTELAGNLKFDAAPLPDDNAARKTLEACIGNRPVVLAASTHANEEQQLLAIFPTLQRAVPHLLLIIAPRHPQRGTEVWQQISESKLRGAQRSKGDLPGKTTNVYLADTLGEMGLFMRLSSAVVMGGSYIAHGGHNPLEPLVLGKPVVCGPHMFNFNFMMRALRERGLVTEVTSSADLVSALPKVLAEKVDVDLTSLQGATDHAAHTITKML